ncbi:MAG: glutamate synthase-related protein [Ardenticatenales bacterium]
MTVAPPPPATAPLDHADPALPRSALSLAPNPVLVEALAASRDMRAIQRLADAGPAHDERPGDDSAATSAAADAAPSMHSRPSARRTGLGDPSADGAARGAFHRYHIATRPSPDLADLPSRFLVKVSRPGLAKLLITEAIQYWGHWETVLSRPCVYGVFSGPVGGFAPRPNLCVGCLRCTIQHPSVVRIERNPAWDGWGDSFFTPKMVETVLTEAATGAVPVKGQGYRGRFGGQGWDAVWTDMSEIVRPTRDGIHGREMISTAVDIGGKPMYLTFDAAGAVAGPAPRTTSLPLPALFDAPPDALLGDPRVVALWTAAARALGTLAVLPLRVVERDRLAGDAIAVRLVGRDDASALAGLGFEPRLVEVDDAALAPAVAEYAPRAVTALRLPAAAGWWTAVERGYDHGIRVFHLCCDYHGRGVDATGRQSFVRDILIDAHHALVERGIRDEVTLIASGGIVMAEHLPKAIICGADAVALDTPLVAALQARPLGEGTASDTARYVLPNGLDPAWGTQRLINLCGAWRDQLLEIMGAMGLREVRRLRGELGRAMFQPELEHEAFGGIDGFEG